MKPLGVALLLVGLAVGLCRAADDSSATAPRPTPVDLGLYVKVRLSHRTKMSKLRPGDVVEGSLARDVYAADRKLFPARSPVRLTVDHLEKRPRPANDHWPWVVKAFKPRHQNYPVFKTAVVGQPVGESSLQVSLISVSRLREVHAQAKGDRSGQLNGDERGAVEISAAYRKKPVTPTMVLEAANIENPPLVEEDQHEARPQPSSPGAETIPAATRCKILLLNDVSASKSRPGDVIRARLLEPVLLNSKVVLPAGSLFEGKVVKKTPPRWLSRAGSLYLAFTQLTLPQGARFPVAASLVGAELDQASHAGIDSEGQLHGERPGRAWMAINIGVTAGLAKEVDDTLQLVIEATVSTATDASTAGTARIVASCVSGLYMVTRHGRDVVVPRFTEMEISLDRPVSLDPTPGNVASAAAAAGK
jgi:hypothetical protein